MTQGSKLGRFVEVLPGRRPAARVVMQIIGNTGLLDGEGARNRLLRSIALWPWNVAYSAHASHNRKRRAVYIYLLGLPLF